MEWPLTVLQLVLALVQLVLWAKYRARVKSAQRAAQSRAECPHRRGAIDLDSGAWHCYACDAYVYDN